MGAMERRYIKNKADLEAMGVEKEVAPIDRYEKTKDLMAKLSGAKTDEQNQLRWRLHKMLAEFVERIDCVFKKGEGRYDKDALLFIKLRKVEERLQFLISRRNGELHFMMQWGNEKRKACIDTTDK